MQKLYRNLNSFEHRGFLVWRPHVLDFLLLYQTVLSFLLRLRRSLNIFHCKFSSLKLLTDACIILYRSHLSEQSFNDMFDSANNINQVGNVIWFSEKNTFKAKSLQSRVLNKNILNKDQY